MRRPRPPLETRNLKPTRARSLDGPASPPARDARSASAPLGVGDTVEVVVHGPCAPLASAITVAEKGAREAAGGGSMHGATSMYGANAAVNVDSGLTANVMA